MSVLLDIVSAAMPRSNSIPLLGYYIILAIVLCAVGVGVSMFLLAISRQLIQSGELPSERTYRQINLSFLLVKILFSYRYLHLEPNLEYRPRSYKHYRDSREPLNQSGSSGGGGENANGRVNGGNSNGL